MQTLIILGVYFTHLHIFDIYDVCYIWNITLNCQRTKKIIFI